MLLIMLVMDYQMKLSIKQWIFFLWKEARNVNFALYVDWPGGNPQWPGVLDLFRKPKISWSNLMADLKGQSKHCDKIHGSFGYKIFKRNNC